MGGLRRVNRVKGGKSVMVGSGNPIKSTKFETTEEQQHGRKRGICSIGETGGLLKKGGEHGGNKHVTPLKTGVGIKKNGNTGVHREVHNNYKGG